MQTKLQRLDYWLIMCRAKNIFATWWGRGILCSQPCSGCQGCCNPCVKSYFQLCFARIICFRCQKMHKRTEVKIFISKLIEYCFLLWRKTNKKTEQKSNGLTSVLRIHMDWAKWCRSITLPSLLYRAASTELEEIFKAGREINLVFIIILLL